MVVLIASERLTSPRRRNGLGARGSTYDARPARSVDAGCRVVSARTRAGLERRGSAIFAVRTSVWMAALAFVVTVCGGVGPASALVTPSGPAATLQGNGSIDEAGSPARIRETASPSCDWGNRSPTRPIPGSPTRWGRSSSGTSAPAAGTAGSTTAPDGARRPSLFSRPGEPGPDSPLYTDQPMHEGLNYITMRDGITLAATVRYPYGQSCSAASPCPTVIEYSGYNVAGPPTPSRR